VLLCLSIDLSGVVRDRCDELVACLFSCVVSAVWGFSYAHCCVLYIGLELFVLCLYAMSGMDLWGDSRGVDSLYAVAGALGNVVWVYGFMDAYRMVNYGVWVLPMVILFKLYLCVWVLIVGVVYESYGVAVFRWMVVLGASIMFESVERFIWTLILCFRGYVLRLRRVVWVVVLAGILLSSRMVYGVRRLVAHNGCLVVGHMWLLVVYGVWDVRDRVRLYLFVYLCLFMVVRDCVDCDLVGWDLFIFGHVNVWSRVLCGVCFLFSGGVPPCCLWFVKGWLVGDALRDRLIDVLDLVFGWLFVGCVYVFMPMVIWFTAYNSHRVCGCVAVMLWLFPAWCHVESRVATLSFMCLGCVAAGCV